MIRAMKATLTSLVLISCSAGFSQTSELFDKAPPEIDEALRARVDRFYQAHVKGKYSEAFPMVAEDFRDEFIGANKEQYKSCETIRVNYSENFTKAAVVESCKGEWRWRGHVMPATMPLSSNWKVVNGQWYWYTIKQDGYVTPFGVMHPAPEAPGEAGKAPQIPSDFNAFAKNVLSSVKTDKNEVRLQSDLVSEDQIEIGNGMPGAIALSVDPTGLPGLSVKIGKEQLAAGEKTTIVFRYDAGDPTVQCMDCAKRVKEGVTATVHVQPTNQVIPIHVAFSFAKPATR